MLLSHFNSPFFHFLISVYIENSFLLTSGLCGFSIFSCDWLPTFSTASGSISFIFFWVRLWTKEAILSPNQKELSGHNRFQTIYSGPQGAVLTHLPHYKAIWWVIMSQNVKSVHFSSKGCTQDRVRWKNYELTADIWAIFLPFIFNFTHFMHFQGQFLTLIRPVATCFHLFWLHLFHIPYQCLTIRETRTQEWEEEKDRMADSRKQMKDR